MKKTFLYISIMMIGIVSYGQSDKDLVMETVHKSTIEGHIYFLADDVLKGRDTGSPEIEIAASYLANMLRGYGVKPNPLTGDYYQEVSLQKNSPPKRVEFSVGKESYKQRVIMDGIRMDFSGNAVFLGYGLEDDYKGVDVREKLVLVRAGSDEANTPRAAYGLIETKKKLAMENGAVGVVEFLRSNKSTWGMIDYNFNGDRIEIGDEDPQKAKEKMASKGGNYAHVWVFDEYGTYASNLEKGGEQNARLKISGKTILPMAAKNIVGIVEGTDPELKNEYIIYSAHYDHVGIGTPDENGDNIYNGARDNAVGVTTVLSMAENLAKHPTKRSALFIFFTGEEKGLLGSRYYVENPILPLNQMVYCFNSDNGGYNDTSLATIIGLPRTTAAENIKTAVAEFGLTAIDDPAPEQGLFDRSDNVNFAAKGIPAPTFSMGFTAFNGDVTKYYHRPSDHADNMDYDYLEKFFRAYVMAGRLIANDPQTPFWTAGDKYEEAGKALYGVQSVRN